MEQQWVLSAFVNKFSRNSSCLIWQLYFHHKFICLFVDLSRLFFNSFLVRKWDPFGKLLYLINCSFMFNVSLTQVYFLYILNLLLLLFGWVESVIFILPKICKLIYLRPDKREHHMIAYAKWICGVINLKLKTWLVNRL